MSLDLIPAAPVDPEEPQFETIDGTRYLKGRNGKRWRCPPGIRYHYRELYEAMSAGFYGRPKLNDQERAMFDDVLPFFVKLCESAEEQFDDLEAGEPTCFAGGRATIDLDPEEAAYRLAEELIAQGWRPPC